jgi:trypsin
MQPRVVGGIPANRAATPWFVLIAPVVGGQQYACGATAISPRWLLTAAHCVTSSTGVPQSGPDIAQSAAFVNPVSLAQIGPAIRWSSVTVNPGWNANLGTGDVALIRTDAAMAVTPLPVSSDTSGPTSGTALKVFGFGATSYGGSLSNTLLQGNVLDLAGTVGSCGGYGGWYHNSVQVCAGLNSGGVDACQGDSGGPLTAPAAGVPVSVGIVSWGVDCGAPGYPGVYTRTATYAGWIQSVTGVVPNPTPVGVRSPGVLVAAKPCGGRACKLSTKKRLTIRLRNAGGSAVSWAVSGKKISASPRSGSLASGAEWTSALRVSNKRKACTKVNVVGDGKTVTSFKVALNGQKKC